MRNRIILALVVAGIAGAFVSAYLYARSPTPQPPAFKPASNPYSEGIYAEGIVESLQAQGENINIYPEVSGTVVSILVSEGQSVAKGTPIIAIDDSVQRATVEQQEAQASAALAMLDELKAQPRPETLEVSQAQMDMAAAGLKQAQDTLAKQQHAYDVEPKSVSRDTLDNDINAAKVAKASLDVTTRQYELTKAGAWVYDIENQQRQYEALSKQAMSSDALLAKYLIKAPTDGSVLSIQTTVGAYVSPQGAYDTYTQGFDPVVVMGPGLSEGVMAVRCYIDEVLIPRLPPPGKIKARMFIRGSETSVPMELVRVQPYVTPKIQLSDERQEKVDLRVLPVIFRINPPPGVQLSPGELVDVYVSDQDTPDRPEPHQTAMNVVKRPRVEPPHAP